MEVEMDHWGLLSFGASPMDELQGKEISPQENKGDSKIDLIFRSEQAHTHSPTHNALLISYSEWVAIPS